MEREEKTRKLKGKENPILSEKDALSTHTRQAFWVDKTSFSEVFFSFSFFKIIVIIFFNKTSDEESDAYFPPRSAN